MTNELLARIGLLEKENQELEQVNADLQLQNFNLKIDIMVKKKSLPSQKIKDKTFWKLYDMPTYEELEKENKELKKYLEEYKATNEVLSQELTKDKMLQQDHLITCCGIPIVDIPKLINQQKEFIKYLEDEWAKHEYISAHEIDDNIRHTEQKIRSNIFEILQKYKEIVQTKIDKSV